MNNKIAISVGTTAYNEEKTITKMLRSVYRQNGKSFYIREILVISDGSTDKTADLVTSLNNKNIKLFNDGERKGQSQRIVELLSEFKGEYLILLDSDLFINDDDAFEKLISSIIANKRIGLAAAHLRPLPPKTFLEEAINNYRYGQEYLEDQYSFNNSIYGAHGCLIYSKKFGKLLRAPDNILNFDSFSYICCKEKGYKFTHIENAIISYRSPQTVSDFINQATRHYTGGLQLNEYFGNKLVHQAFSVPKQIMLKLMIYQILKHPFGYIFLKLLNIYCQYISRTMLQKSAIAWKYIGSSKNI